MSDGTRRNNTRSLRIRITPPVNNTGEEKLWNRNRWVKKSNVIRRARAKAFEDAALVNKLYDELEELKGQIMASKRNNPDLPILVAKLKRHEKLLTEAERTGTESTTDYLYLRNGTPRRGGKSKKRR
jgi:hypothetical protein